MPRPVPVTDRRVSLRLLQYLIYPHPTHHQVGRGTGFVPLYLSIHSTLWLHIILFLGDLSIFWMDESTRFWSVILLMLRQIGANEPRGNKCFATRSQTSVFESVFKFSMPPHAGSQTREVSQGVKGDE